MSFHTKVYCIMSCSHNICPLHMSRVCLHLGVHEYHMSNDTWRELLGMTYQYVANEVMKIPMVKTSSTVIAMSKQFLADYIFNSP